MGWLHFTGKASVGLAKGTYNAYLPMLQYGQRLGDFDD